MPRIQLTIPDELDQDLNRLFTSRDKRLFVQKALQFALDNEDFCRFFGVKRNSKLATTSNKVKPIKHTNEIKPADKNPNKATKTEIQQIEFDQEFE